MVKKVQVYEASDGKQFKTKLGAENHEKRLAVKKVEKDLSMTHQEISEALNKVARWNNLIDRLFKDVNEDWKKWNLNLIRQITKDLLKEPKKKTVYKLNNDEIATEKGDEFADSNKYNEDKYEVSRIEKIDEYNIVVHLDYKKTWEERIYDKLMEGERLTEDEIRSMTFELSQVHEEEGDEGRWERYMVTVVELMDKQFAIEWSRGLTEMQENSFYTQPYEVKVEEKELTITKTVITRI